MPARKPPTLCQVRPECLGPATVLRTLTNGFWPPSPGKAGEDSLRWGGGWERRAPPAREGRSAVLPLVVPAGSEACRRTGSPPSLPPAPCLLLSASFPLLVPPPPGSPPIPRIHLRRSWTRTPLSGRRPRGKALHSDLCFPHWLLTVRAVNLHALCTPVLSQKCGEVWPLLRASPPPALADRDRGSRVGCLPPPRHLPPLSVPQLAFTKIPLCARPRLQETKSQWLIMPGVHKLGGK